MPPIPVSIFLVFLWHQNPSGKPNSRIVFQYGFDMMLRYEFDALWIWGCDFDMVLLSFWYGFRYDLDMVLECFGYDFDMVLMRCWCDFDLILIWFRWVGFKNGNRNSPGTGFWSISRGFLWFWYVFKWFWYGFDTVLMRFWGDVDVIWFWYVFKLYIHVCVYVYIYLFIYLTKKHIHTIENLKRNINHTFDPSKTQIWPISKL
jgi:hypothetical protein